jgi:hypothetical protein
MSTETIEKPAVQEQIEAVLADVGELRSRGDSEARFEVKFSTTWEEMQKMHAWWKSDIYEKAEETRKSDLAECTKSLEFAVNYASKEYGSGATVFATFLASLYNGNRVKADISDISLLDMHNFEHLMNVQRLCFMTHREPHSFFKNGNEVFEYIIKRHGLEKRRKS